MNPLRIAIFDDSFDRHVVVGTRLRNDEHMGEHAIDIVNRRLTACGADVVAWDVSPFMEASCSVLKLLRDAVLREQAPGRDDHIDSHTPDVSGREG